MKLIKKQIDGQAETEVEVRYAKMDTEVIKLIERIEQTENFICGTDNGRQYKIRTSDIYYAESVDKKTFIYTKEAVFRSNLRLYQLIEILKADDFVQVSKFCLINMNALESIRTLFNSRLEAILINGEKVNVSRTYLTNVNMAFASKAGDSE
ncbi:MAG: LytTR family transcriptional regulator DNA-binding domain-containing protein [Clostridiales bacterium]|nr:LytTR family transcriptional regulator DNA-binding domain-containing protein [Clostridiales bacterium]